MDGQKIHSSVYNYFLIDSKYEPKAPPPRSWAWGSLTVAQEQRIAIEEDGFDEIKATVASIKESLERGEQCDRKHYLALESIAKSGKSHRY